MFGPTSVFAKVVTLTALVCGAAYANAEELYQWKDKDGTITYSTTPPPADITTKYEEINTRQDSPSMIRSAEPKVTTEKPLLAKPVIEAVEQPTSRQESRLERMLRLSPEPIKNPEPQVEQPTLQPVNQDKVRKQRKCRDLSNRVDAIEARLRTVNSAAEMNQSMLLLTKYQNSFDRYCN